MVRNCHSLAVDGMNLLQALELISTQSGMQFHETHSNETQDDELRVLSDLNFWCPGDMDIAALSLERGGSQFDDDTLRDVSDFFEANNVNSATLQLDYGNTFGQVKVAGDRKFVAVRSELMPQWQPDSRWDDVSAQDAVTYLEDAMVEDEPFTEDTGGLFYPRHNRKGGNFFDDENSIIGRLWGIDPPGELDPDEYNRQEGSPFDDYSPWEFPGENTAVRRRRVMRPLPGVDTRNQPLGVILEASFDAGATWNRLVTRFRLLATRTAILFDTPSLLSLGKEIIENLTVNPNNVVNYYDAFLRGVFRLRATFEIDTDQCLLETASTTASPLADQAPTKLICKPRDFQYNALDASVDATIAEKIEERDDRDTAKRLAEAHLAKCAGANWKGNPIIPWIETDDYPLGTPIEGIKRSASGPVEIKFGGSASQNDLYPCVIQKTYRPNDQTTELTLHDHTMRKGLAP